MSAARSLFRLAPRWYVLTLPALPQCPDSHESYLLWQRICGAQRVLEYRVNMSSEEAAVWRQRQTPDCGDLFVSESCWSWTLQLTRSGANLEARLTFGSARLTPSAAQAGWTVADWRLCLGNVLSAEPLAPLSSWIPQIEIGPA